MKGVVFNILEDFIVEHWGEAMFEEVVAVCPVHATNGFLGPHTYPDADLYAIVGATCRRLGVAPEVAIRSFGRYMFPKLAARYPVFLQGHDDPRVFLKTVDRVIHVEVRKLMRETALPVIRCTDREDGAMTIEYASSRNLCVLFAGLLDGVADHFGTPIDHVETACTLRGACACTFALRFPTLEEVTA